MPRSTRSQKRPRRRKYGTSTLKSLITKKVSPQMKFSVPPQVRDKCRSWVEARGWPPAIRTSRAVDAQAKQFQATFHTRTAESERPPRLGRPLRWAIHHEVY